MNDGQETSEETLAALPGVLADVARLAGVRAALELAGCLGGTSVYVAKDPRPDSLLVKAVGLNAAVCIAAEFGGGNIEVPLGPACGGHQQRAAIRRLLGEGLCVQEIARRLHCHSKTVRREQRRDNSRRQPDLFDS